MSHRRSPAPYLTAPDPRPLLSRRTLLLTGAACTALAACNSTVYEDAGTVFGMLISGLPDAPVTRDQISKLPYATVRAKIGKGQRSVLVLRRYDGQDLIWVSSDGVAFATRRGRLVKTAGLPADLKRTEFRGSDPVANGLQDLVGDAHLDRFVDLEPAAQYGVRIASEFAAVGGERIEILGREYDALHVRERNVATLLDWEFDNQYWVGAEDGFVWKSVQHYAPDWPPIELEILKPAAKVKI